MDGKGNRPTGWMSPERSHTEKFVCGYCTHLVASDSGWDASENGVIRICPECRFPTFIGCGPDGASRMVVPPIAPGRLVENVPEPTRTLYAEARHSAGVGAYTASVLLCRKMLINLAIDAGDTWERNKPFWRYVEFINARLFAAESGQVWIDRIRDQGNKATHELGVQGASEALRLIGYIEMLLRLLYELPGNELAPIDSSLAAVTSQ